MLIRLEPCANGFVLGAHWKSFHSTVQIQWARSVSQVHSGWKGCFSSLLRRWRALTARKRHWVWNGSSRSSSPPHMQCVLSSPYLISSAAAERRACMCLYVCASVVAFLSEGATKCILFLPHLILRLAGNWQSCPRHSNYFIEQRCFLWHDASQKIPHSGISCQIFAEQSSQRGQQPAPKEHSHLSVCSPRQVREYKVVFLSIGTQTKCTQGPKCADNPSKQDIQILLNCSPSVCEGSKHVFWRCCNIPVILFLS